MRSLIGPRVPLWLGLGLALVQGPVLAADPCSSFTWDVRDERTLFASAASPAAAGVDSASAPLLDTGHLYVLQLQPASRVRFAATPGRKAPAGGPYAGLASVRIAAPGAYRISVNAPFWIDVVADGGLMAAKGFQGAAGCDAPHKIVSFDFPVARQVTLQFSGAANSVRVSITMESSR
jgi:hypothetical protein